MGTRTRVPIPFSTENHICSQYAMQGVAREWEPVSVREPVPVILCLPVRETIFAINIFSYQFFISSRTGMRMVRIRVRVRLGKILRVNIVSRTGRNGKRVWEDIDRKYGFPQGQDQVRVRVRVGKILRVNMVSRTERHKKRVREDIENKYGFPYWKKLNMDRGSRTGTGSRTLGTSYMAY